MPIYIGMDSGKSNTKYAVKNNEGILELASFPTQVKESQDDSQIGDTKFTEVEWDGKRYFVGEELDRVIS
ncbi:MAG: hypothetical protein FWF59_11535 [Turicibacter sp.]|nr:hypothetical protein [Turicibacter sp.]